MQDEKQIPADTTYALHVRHNQIYSARHSGLYCSIDGGKTWSTLFQQTVDDQTIPVLTVQTSPRFDTNQMIVAGISGGIIRSSDGGETWTVHHFRNPVPMVTTIALSPTFSDDHTILAGTYEDGMFRSTDDGGTWHAFNFGLLDHNILCTALSPAFADDQTAFVGTSSGIFKSINGGRLWQDVSLPVGYDAVLSLMLSNDFARDGHMMIGTESNGLLQSNDSGETWETLYATDGAVNTIVPGPDYAKSGSLMIHLNDAVMQSEDSGKSWRTVRSENVQIIGTSEDHRTVIAVGHDGTLEQFDFL